MTQPPDPDPEFLRTLEAEGLMNTDLEHDLFRWIWGWDLSKRAHHFAIQVMIAEGWTWERFRALWERTKLSMNSYTLDQIRAELQQNDNSHTRELHAYALRVVRSHKASSRDHK
jgi:hypothetical protein